MIRSLVPAAALMAALCLPAAAQDPQLVRMGTANLAGVYFPVGVAVCRLSNAERAEHGIRCAALPSEGSVANVAALRAGDVELALVQSDVQAAAVEGSGVFAEAGAFDDLRAVMSLHTEPLTIVARADAGIDGLQALEGTRLGYGPEGSGDRVLWDRVVEALGWSDAQFSETRVLAPGDQSQALCTDAVDAFVYAVGHPAQSVQEATLTCDARLVPVEGPAIDTLVAGSRTYSDTEVAGGLYRGNPDPTPSFGVSATLVARADVPDDTVYTIVSTALDQIDTLRGLDPVLADLDPQRMATTGLTAPLHPGAERYFRERGWIE